MSTLQICMGTAVTIACSIVVVHTRHGNTKFCLCVVFATERENFQFSSSDCSPETLLYGVQRIDALSCHTEPRR